MTQPDKSTSPGLSGGAETTALWEILLLCGADVSEYGYETRTEAGREACFQEWFRRGSASEVVEAVRQLRSDYDEANSGAFD